MNRVRTLLLLLVVSLASDAAWAAPPADPGRAEGLAAVSGTYVPTLNVSLDSAPPVGAAILCKARIAPNLPSFQNLNNRMVPAETATGLATVSGNSANCSVQIPFSWAVSDPRGGIALIFEVAEVSASGSFAVARSAQQGIGVAYPAGQSHLKALAFGFGRKAPCEARNRSKETPQATQNVVRAKARLLFVSVLRHD
jgi:hypothetical protein